MSHRFASFTLLPQVKRCSKAERRCKSGRWGGEAWLATPHCPLLEENGNRRRAGIGGGVERGGGGADRIISSGLRRWEVSATLGSPAWPWWLHLQERQQRQNEKIQSGFSSLGPPTLSFFFPFSFPPLDRFGITCAMLCCGAPPPIVQTHWAMLIKTSRAGWGAVHTGRRGPDLEMAREQRLVSTGEHKKIMTIRISKKKKRKKKPDWRDAA